MTLAATIYNNYNNTYRDKFYQNSFKVLKNFLIWFSLTTKKKKNSNWLYYNNNMFLLGIYVKYFKNSNT